MEILTTKVGGDKAVAVLDEKARVSKMVGFNISLMLLGSLAERKEKDRMEELRVRRERP